MKLTELSNGDLLDLSQILAVVYQEPAYSITTHNINVVTVKCGHICLDFSTREDALLYRSKLGRMIEEHNEQEKS